MRPPQAARPSSPRVSQRGQAAPAGVYARAQQRRLRLRRRRRRRRRPVVGSESIQIKFTVRPSARPCLCCCVHYDAIECDAGDRVASQWMDG